MFKQCSDTTIGATALDQGCADEDIGIENDHPSAGILLGKHFIQRLLGQLRLEVPDHRLEPVISDEENSRRSQLLRGLLKLD